MDRLERLGDDELANIFSKIPKDHFYYANTPNAQNSFSQVSKRFLKIACTGLRTLNISFPDLMFDIIPTSPKMYRFRCSMPLSNAHMELLAHPHPNLKILSLELEQDIEPGKFDFDDDGLCAVAKGCSNLLDVILSRRLHVRDAGVVSLVRSCKKLKYLNLEGCSSVTDESLKAIGESSSIRRLVLKDCWISDLGMKYVANGDLKTRLQELNLSECERISDNGIIYLKQMVCLTHLNLSKCGANVTEYGIVALVSQLPNIEMLDLSWVINISDISLSAIGSRCLKLVKVCLTGCDAITGEGLRAFSGHQTLKDLVLFSCHNFSWEDLASVASTCTALEYLGLSKKIKTPTPEGSTDYLRIGDRYCGIDWDEDSGTLFW